MTTESDPNADPAEVIGLRRELTRLQQQLHAVEARHRLEIERIMASPRYRIGSTIASLGTTHGWRRLPAELRSIWRSTRRRSTGRLNAPGQGVTSRSSITADSILDEFSQRAFEHELTLRPVARRRPSRRVVDPELFLAESAWLGNGGRWRHQFSHFEPGNDLAALLERYERGGVPSVLWNKEDPAHFDTFIAAAARFGHVFTTDADCVARYRSALGHDRVAALPFAAQPAIHNPIGREVEARSLCFAGAWRGDVHPQRVEQLTLLLDAALEAGDLRIYARRPSEGRADFPDRYMPAIAGELAYDEMITEYRRHACFLNVNTVTDSPTMMSRRVFEILACRTPVVSAPSSAVEQFFDGIVPMPSSAKEATDVLAELVGDPFRRDRLGHLGFRTVMTSHTYQHRVATICEALAIDGFPSPKLPDVDITFDVDAVDDVPRALAAAEPLRSGANGTVIVCRDGDDDAPPRVESRLDVHLVHTGPSVPAGRILRDLPGAAPFVAFLDADATYGSAILTDALLASRFVDADVYGKSSSYAGDPTGVRAIGDGREFCSTIDVVDGTAIVRRSVLAEAAIDRHGGASIGRAAVAASGRRFAVDRFNHVAGLGRATRTTSPAQPFTDVLF